MLDFACRRNRTENKKEVEMTEHYDCPLNEFRVNRFDYLAENFEKYGLTICLICGAIALGITIWFVKLVYFK